MQSSLKLKGLGYPADKVGSLPIRRTPLASATRDIRKMALPTGVYAYELVDNGAWVSASYATKATILYKLLQPAASFCLRLVIPFFSIFSITTQVSAQNILVNGDFESNPPSNFGNNFPHSVSPWVLTGGQPNVIKVDGPGGILYGTANSESGPQSDATLADPGIVRHYLDIVSSNASFYQSFVAASCPNGASTASATYTLRGFFSARDGLAGNGSIALREGVGLSGAQVAGSSVTVNSPVQRTNKQWQLATATVSLVPGQTYSYVATMDDGANFDQASLEFDNIQCPAVSLTKSTNSTPRQVGDTLLYSFSARNSSVPTSITINNFSLSDAKCASAITLQSATVASNDTLEASETQIYTCTSVPVTQAEYDAGSVLNTVTGSGTPSAGSLGPISASLATPLSRAADLSISKSNGVTNVFSGTTVNYTVVATNNSPSTVTGARVTDVVGPRVTCPPGNPVNISGSGVPAGSYTIADLTGAGITLAALSSGQSATLNYSCQVN